jgi:hypothetical protein
VSEAQTETVWVPGGASRRTRKRYHTDAACRYVTGTSVQRTLASLPEGFTECGYCAGTIEDAQPPQNPSLRELIASGAVETHDADPHAHTLAAKECGDS